MLHPTIVKVRFGFFAFDDTDGGGGEFYVNVGILINPFVDKFVHIEQGVVAQAGVKGSDAGGGGVLVNRSLELGRVLFIGSCSGFDE